MFKRVFSMSCWILFFIAVDGQDSHKTTRGVVRDAAKVLKVLIPVGVSAALVLWLFHKVDFAEIRTVVRQGVDYRYIFLMMAITVLSHVIRGIRWGIQLRAAGIPRIPVIAESVSIWGAYALNLLFPFLGEAWRCVYISRRESCKLSTVVGTDIGDRASDGLMIGLLILLMVAVARPEFDSFLDRYPVGEAVDRLISNGDLWLGLFLFTILLIGLDRIFRKKPLVHSFNASVRRIWSGFSVLFHMKGTGLYILLTLGIWTCYYLETYVCFFAFPFTRTLLENDMGLVAGLVVFVFGSCSMIVPSNGGLGPWNIAVMFALGLFGISQSDGAAYSLVCWSFQAVVLIASGVFSAFYIMFSRRRHKR